LHTTEPRQTWGVSSLPIVASQFEHFSNSVGIAMVESYHPLANGRHALSASDNNPSISWRQVTEGGMTGRGLDNFLRGKHQSAPPRRESEIFVGARLDVFDTA
jgi:hypothetical protein